MGSLNVTNLVVFSCNDAIIKYKLVQSNVMMNVDSKMLGGATLSWVVLLGDHPVNLLRTFALCTLGNVVIRRRD